MSKKKSNADNILDSVYQILGIHNLIDEQKYDRINDIVESLQLRNAHDKIDGKTTGTISERLCELALRAKVSKIYKKIPGEWNWMADFSILGHPFNLLVSVKSLKAKERLLVSGSGNILSPTVGWALFDDPKEWTEPRTRIYLFRSFIAVYMPLNLLNAIPPASKTVNNINGKPLLRSLNNFMADLEEASQSGVIDITKF